MPGSPSTAWTGPVPARAKANVPRPANRSSAGRRRPIAATTSSTRMVSAASLACRKAPGGNATARPERSTRTGRRSTTRISRAPARQTMRARSHPSPSRASAPSAPSPGGCRSLDQQIDTAVGAGQHRLGRTAGRQQIGDQSPQRADEREQWRLEHQAFAQIDEIVAKPLAKPDPRRLPRIAWPREPEPGPSPHRRHLPQRRDRCRVDPDPFERIQEAGELDRLVEDRLDMLQRAPAAAAEMATGWRGASWTRVEQLDHPPFAAAATAGAEPGANAIARGGERQIDRLALPSRDAVGAGADSFDQQLDGPALRRRYHGRSRCSWPRSRGVGRSYSHDPI